MVHKSSVDSKAQAELLQRIRLALLLLLIWLMGAEAGPSARGGNARFLRARIVTARAIRRHCLSQNQLPMPGHCQPLESMMMVTMMGQPLQQSMTMLAHHFP